MNDLVSLAADFALWCLAAAMLMATLRFFLGPSAQDRVLAFDTLYLDGMLTLIVLGLRSGSAVYFDVALLIALTGFMGTTALAKFLLRGQVIEP
jgi:multicomponent K+:H+ antiporter subunit F